VPPPDPDILARLVQTFLGRAGKTPYPYLRPRFLDFCLRQAVTPGQVAGVLTHPPDGWPAADPGHTQAMATDWPVTYVCRAHQLFWT
jgi:hypothetical protein